jgi:hypothetical protein
VKQSVGKKACLVGQALEINYFRGSNYLEVGTKLILILKIYCCIIKLTGTNVFDMNSLVWMLVPLLWQEVWLALY